MHGIERRRRDPMQEQMQSSAARRDVSRDLVLVQL